MMCSTTHSFLKVSRIFVWHVARRWTMRHAHISTMGFALHVIASIALCRYLTPLSANEELKLSVSSINEKLPRRKNREKA